ncbi:hypothetical protein HN911_13460 [Candidatus Bathyarchaeota archaeon]|nr:hypothetical protein [Candidatus Bathyarchaeota archaeon]
MTTGKKFRIFGYGGKIPSLAFSNLGFFTRTKRMTVRELKEILEKYNDDAPVLLQDEGFEVRWFNLFESKYRPHDPTSLIVKGDFSQAVME